jgi:hypothetical protein
MASITIETVDAVTTIEITTSNIVVTIEITASDAAMMEQVEEALVASLSMGCWRLTADTMTEGTSVSW